MVKKLILSKGVNPWFLSKKRNLEIIFFLRKTSLEKVFDNVLFGKRSF